MNIRLLLGSAALAGSLTISQWVLAQRQPPAQSLGSPPTAEQAAPFDLTGYWTSVVTEDWRWRMMTPAKGDYASIPINTAGRKLADQFSPALYGGATDTGNLGGGAGEGQPVEVVPIGRYQVSGIIDCRAYGAAGIMRMPTRLHISWANPNELRLETDWGEQTRLLHFIPGRPYADELRPIAIQEANHGPPSLQGYAVAVWEQPYRVDARYYQRGGRQNRQIGGIAGATINPVETGEGGDLAAITTDLAPGWLRRNGVPYGAHTQLIEHFLIFHDPTGAKWFDVTTQVIDPEYLAAPFLTSSDFQKEPDGIKWAPHPCKQVAGEQ